MGINNNLKKYFNEADRAAVNLSMDLDRKLFLAYENTLTEIKNKIQAVYEKFGDTPSITEVRKFNRLVNIESDINKKLVDLNKYSTKEIGKNIKTQALNMYDSTLSGMNNVGFNFTNLIIDDKSLKTFLSDTLWHDAMNNNTAVLMSDVKREFETVLRANAREEIISGVAQGKSFRDVSKALTERFDISKKRAKVITLTETHKAQMFGRSVGIEKGLDAAERLGLKAGKVWRHNGVGVPRPDHVEADGQFANEDGFFNVGGEELEAPGLGSDPANNINCHCSAEFEFPDEAGVKEELLLRKEEGIISDQDEIELKQVQSQISNKSIKELGSVQSKILTNTKNQSFSALEKSSFDYGEIKTTSQLNKAKATFKERHNISVSQRTRGKDFPTEDFGRAIKDLDKILTDLKQRVVLFEENAKPFRLKLYNDYRTSSNAVASITRGSIDPLMTAATQLRSSGTYYNNFTYSRITLGSNTAASGFASNIRHELSHSIEHQLLIRRDSKGVSAFDLFSKYKPETITKNISKYASSDLSEFLAESFSVITDPIYFSSLNKSRLPFEIEKWFIEILKIKR